MRLSSLKAQCCKVVSEAGKLRSRSSRVKLPKLQAGAVVGKAPFSQALLVKALLSQAAKALLVKAVKALLVEALLEAAGGEAVQG